MFKRILNKSSLKYNKKYFSQTISSDILVVGGGVPGLGFISALLKSDYFNNSNKKIVLIDQESKLNKEDFIYKPNRLPELRVISMTPASVNFFRSIGLYSHLNEQLIKPVTSMQIYESKGSGFVHMDQNDSNKFSSLRKIFNGIPNKTSEPICYLVEINHLLFAFKQLLGDKIQIINTNLNYADLNIDQSESYVNLRTKELNIETKLIVASDGAKSVVRNRLHIPTVGYEYNETGLVCTLRANEASDTAYQRFLHNGVFALLPLYDDLFSIVCSMPKNINEKLKTLSDKEFIEFVNRILQDPSFNDFSQLDRLSYKNNRSNPPIITEVLSKRIDFPLQLQYAKQTVKDNVVLIGDAAHSIHPMAGQGLNLGIADSALLAHHLIENINQGRRLNDKRGLSEYESAANYNTKKMIVAIEAIKNIYKPTNYLFSGIRNLGMSIFNQSSYIKGLLMLEASGQLTQPKQYAWEI